MNGGIPKTEIIQPIKTLSKLEKWVGTMIMVPLVANSLICAVCPVIWILSCSVY